jgi:hypothetical protein
MSCRVVRQKSTDVSGEHVASSEALLAASFMLVSCLDYSSVVQMEAKCSSETSTEFQRTAPRYVPEDRTLQDSRFLLRIQCERFIS